MIGYNNVVYRAHQGYRMLYIVTSVQLINDKVNFIQLDLGLIISRVRDVEMHRMIHTTINSYYLLQT